MHKDTAMNYFDNTYSTNLGVTNTGTIEKYDIILTLPNNITMEAADFAAKFFYRAPRACTVKKADMIKLSENCYRAIVDTSLTGAGECMKCEITAVFDDSDVAGGKRTVVKTFNVGEKIEKSL